MDTEKKLPLPEQRARLHRMWGSVSGGWDEHAAFVETRGARITERLLELAAPARGERVLELGCGAGGVGIEAAKLVGDVGEVVLSDVAPEMTTIAARRVEALGLQNVTTRVLDLEEIDEPEASFDVVLCREALMLVGEPVRAAREIRRVLRPHGRVALSVWGPRQRNPWLGIVFDSISTELGTPLPPAGVPGPFSLDEAATLRSVFVAAGFPEVDVSELATPYRAASVEEWWIRTAALAGPLAQRLALLPEPAADALRERAAEAIGVYATTDGLDVPGVSLVAFARRG